MHFLPYLQDEKLNTITEAAREKAIIKSNNIPIVVTFLNVINNVMATGENFFLHVLIDGCV